MNTEHNNENNIKNAVLEKIRDGKVRMRPKTYFILKVIALIVVAFIVLLTSSLLVSFILFTVAISGRLLLLGFGWKGIEVFFLSFPWWLLLVDIIFIALLEWLLKRFQFGYKNPAMYTLGGILFITLLVGLIIEHTPLHSALLHQEDQNELPVIGGFYHDIRRPPHESGVFRGVVISLSGNTFVINSDEPDSDDATSSLLVKVVLDPSVKASDVVMIGDHVFVAGNIIHDEVHPYGLTKIGTTSVSGF